MANSLEFPGASSPVSTSTLHEASDLIVRHLEQIGVEYVFGVPGGAIEPLYNALARSERRGGIRPIVARHESGAAFMADGYFRETGILGVCCATTGPGATNMITGAASAYQDDIPMLLITAQTPLATFGKGAVQESSCTAVNTVAMMSHCTHYNTLVSHIDQLELKLSAAIATAFRSKGPVHLSVPLDILRSPIELATPPTQLPSLLYEPKLVDSSVVNTLRERIRTARHTIVIVGEGCAKASDDIVEFAERSGALLLTTPQGKGLIDPYHPSYRGVCGLAGHRDANALLTHPAADLVIVAGSVLDQQAGQGWLESPALSGKLVHVDSLARHFDRSQHADLHVSGDIEAVFRSLLPAIDDHQHAQPKPWDKSHKSASLHPNIVPFERRVVDRRRRATTAGRSGSRERRHRDRRHVAGRSMIERSFALTNEHKYHADTSPIKPQRLMYELSRLCPAGTRFLADIGNSFLWAIHYLQPHCPGSRGKGASPNYFRASMGFASMGWAIGGAVGTALGNPDHPVVCIVGDGSFLMSGQEITTAVMHELPIVYVILNDEALGTVKHGQRLAGAEPVAYELPPVDFATLACSMGIDAYRIKSPDDMIRLDIKEICRRKGPTLLDVYINGEEIPPLYERMDMLSAVQ